jgi:hypothetical protein
MEINTNMNVSGVNGFIQPGRATAAAKTALDTASFPGSAGLDSALGSLADSRPEAVAMARSLIDDPGYPSSEMVQQLAQHLTSNLTSGNPSLGF